MGLEVKVCQWDLGQMIKMVTMPLYGKKDLGVNLRNRKADDLETWGLTLVYSKNDPWLTVVYFTTSI